LNEIGKLIESKIITLRKLHTNDQKLVRIEKVWRKLNKASNGRKCVLNNQKIPSRYDKVPSSKIFRIYPKFLSKIKYNHRVEKKMG
jgi:hypothetical protein